MVLSSLFSRGKRGLTFGDVWIPAAPKNDDEVLALCLKLAQSLAKRLPTEQDVYWFVVEQYDRLFEQGERVRKILGNAPLFEIEHSGCRSEKSYVGKVNPGVVFLEREVIPTLAEVFDRDAAQRIGATIYVLFCDGFKAEIRRLRTKYAAHYHNNCIASGHYQTADKWASVLSAVDGDDEDQSFARDNGHEEPAKQVPSVARLNWEGNPLTLRLDCGRQVELTDLRYSRTYAGLIEGRTSERLNASILKRIQARKPWGDRATHFISPVVDESDPRHPVLPCVEMHVSLTCHDSLNGNSCGSHLVVSWLSDECHHLPLADVIFRAVRGLNWDELASDFDY